MLAKLGKPPAMARPEPQGPSRHRGGKPALVLATVAVVLAAAPGGVSAAAALRARRLQHQAKHGHGGKVRAHHHEWSLPPLGEIMRPSSKTAAELDANYEKLKLLVTELRKDDMHAAHEMYEEYSQALTLDDNQNTKLEAANEEIQRDIDSVQLRVRASELRKAKLTAENRQLLGQLEDLKKAVNSQVTEIEGILKDNVGTTPVAQPQAPKTQDTGDLLVTPASLAQRGHGIKTTPSLMQLSAMKTEADDDADDEADEDDSDSDAGTGVKQSAGVKQTPAVAPTPMAAQQVAPPPPAVLAAGRAAAGMGTEAELVKGSITSMLSQVQSIRQQDAQSAAQLKQFYEEEGKRLHLAQDAIIARKAELLAQLRETRDSERSISADVTHLEDVNRSLHTQLHKLERFLNRETAVLHGSETTEEKEEKVAEKATTPAEKVAELQTSEDADQDEDGDDDNDSEGDDSE